VVLLPWPYGTVRPRADKRLQELSPGYAVWEGPQTLDVIEAVMYHPNECEVPVTEPLRDWLVQQTGGEPVHLAVASPGKKEPKLWRFDGSSPVLQRVFARGDL
jgi:hypothetical protein